MTASEPLTWVLVTRKDGDGDYALNVCHFCAIVATDDDMVTECIKMENDLVGNETFDCECCGVRIASAP